MQSRILLQVTLVFDSVVLPKENYSCNVRAEMYVQEAQKKKSVDLEADQWHTSDITHEISFDSCDLFLDILATSIK